jgi:hypothetical protein
MRGRTTVRDYRSATAARAPLTAAVGRGGEGGPHGGMGTEAEPAVEQVRARPRVGSQPDPGARLDLEVVRDRPVGQRRGDAPSAVGRVDDHVLHHRQPLPVVQQAQPGDRHAMAECHPHLAAAGAGELALLLHRPGHEAVVVAAPVVGGVAGEVAVQHRGGVPATVHRPARPAVRRRHRASSTAAPRAGGTSRSSSSTVTGETVSPSSRARSASSLSGVAAAGGAAGSSGVSQRSWTWPAPRIPIVCSYRSRNPGSSSGSGTPVRSRVFPKWKSGRDGVRTATWSRA